MQNEKKNHTEYHKECSGGYCLLCLYKTKYLIATMYRELVTIKETKHNWTEL